MKNYIFSYIKENLTIDFYIDDVNNTLILCCVLEMSDKDDENIKSYRVFEKVYSLKDIFEKLRCEKYQLELNLKGDLYENRSN